MLRWEALTKGICAPCARRGSTGRVPGKLDMPIVLVLPRRPEHTEGVNYIGYLFVIGRVTSSEGQMKQ